MPKYTCVEGVANSGLTPAQGRAYWACLKMSQAMGMMRKGHFIDAYELLDEATDELTPIVNGKKP